MRAAIIVFTSFALSFAAPAHAGRSTMVAATCVPGDPAIQADRYFVTAGSVKHKEKATGLITLYCPVQPTIVQGGGSYGGIFMTYTDANAPGTTGHVTAHYSASIILEIFSRLPTTRLEYRRCWTLITHLERAIILRWASTTPITSTTITITSGSISIERTTAPSYFTVLAQSVFLTTEHSGLAYRQIQGRASHRASSITYEAASTAKRRFKIGTYTGGWNDAAIDQQHQAINDLERGVSPHS